MSIKEVAYNFRIRCIETFLERAFMVDDEYTQTLEEYDHALEPDDYLQDQADRAFSMLLGYSELVFKTVFLELNALVEFELRFLAASDSDIEAEFTDITLKQARKLLEKKYAIKLEQIPGAEAVNEVRRIANSYKHNDGLSHDDYEEFAPGMGWLGGYVRKRYKLDWDKTFTSVQKVREFLDSLPGQRKGSAGFLFKPETDALKRRRREFWDSVRVDIPMMVESREGDVEIASEKT